MKEKRAYILLANGFEETEAIGTWDVLKRGGVQVALVSIYDQYEVDGAHGLRLSTCLTLKDLKGELADAIILPGGMPGATNLHESKEVVALVQAHYEAEKVVAAICAAPLVLGREGLLEGKRATCYPGFEKELQGATTTGEGTTVDGHIVTGKGPAYAFHFGIEILRQLKGDEAAKEVADGLLM